MNEALEVVRSLDLRQGDLQLRLSDYSLHAFHQVPTYLFSMMSIDRSDRQGTIRNRTGLNCVLTTGGATLPAGLRLNSERRPNLAVAGRRRLHR